MGIQSIATEIARQWQVVTQAPGLFFASLGVIGYGIFRYVRHEFSTRLANAASTAAMYKERLERFEVDEQVAIATATHDRSARAKQEAPEAVSPPPAAPLPPAPDDEGPREFISEDHDPSSLISLFEGRTQLQAKKLIAGDIGKWMRVRGTVTAVQSIGKEVCIATHISMARMVFSYFDESQSALEAVGLGDLVMIEGKIEDINSLGITLVRCELKERAPASS